MVSYQQKAEVAEESGDVRRSARTAARAGTKHKRDVSEYEEGPIGQVKDELKSLEEFIPPAALPETGRWWYDFKRQVDKAETATQLCRLLQQLEASLLPGVNVFVSAWHDSRVKQWKREMQEVLGVSAKAPEAPAKAVVEGAAQPKGDAKAKPQEQPQPQPQEQPAAEPMVPLARVAVLMEVFRCSLKRVADGLASTRCVICKSPGNADKMLLCDGCDEGYHTTCLNPPLRAIPRNDWYCPKCHATRQELVKQQEELSRLTRRQLRPRKQEIIEEDSSGEEEEEEESEGSEHQGDTDSGESDEEEDARSRTRSAWDRLRDLPARRSDRLRKTLTSSSSSAAGASTRRRGGGEPLFDGSFLELVEGRGRRSKVPPPPSRSKRAKEEEEEDSRSSRDSSRPSRSLRSKKSQPKTEALPQRKRRPAKSMAESTSSSSEEAEDSSAENSTKAKSKAKKQKKQEKEEAEFDPDAAEDVAERSEDEDEESGVEEEEPAGLRRSTRAKAKRRDTLEEDSNSSRP